MEGKIGSLAWGPSSVLSGPSCREEGESPLPLDFRDKAEREEVACS